MRYVALGVVPDVAKANVQVRVCIRKLESCPVGRFTIWAPVPASHPWVCRTTISFPEVVAEPLVPLRPPARSAHSIGARSGCIHCPGDGLRDLILPDGRN